MIKIVENIFNFNPLHNMDDVVSKNYGNLVM